MMIEVLFTDFPGASGVSRQVIMPYVEPGKGAPLLKR